MGTDGTSKVSVIEVRGPSKTETVEVLISQVLANLTTERDIRRMNRILVVVAIVFTAVAAAQTPQPRVLVFSKTAGYRHSSIENGIAAVKKLGAENGFAVDATEDATAFTDKNLRRYRAVIFLSTTGDVLDAVQQAALERYIQAGGGWVGVHSATDTEYDWP